MNIDRERKGVSMKLTTMAIRSAHAAEARRSAVLGVSMLVVSLWVASCGGGATAPVSRHILADHSQQAVNGVAYPDGIIVLSPDSPAYRRVDTPTRPTGRFCSTRSPTWSSSS